MKRNGYKSPEIEDMKRDFDDFCGFFDGWKKEWIYKSERL